jgi:hypothetical protein
MEDRDSEKVKITLRNYYLRVDWLTETIKMTKLAIMSTAKPSMTKETTSP